MIQYNMYVIADEREKEVRLNHTIMKDYPVSEKPYEKALSEGIQVLSDAELLALILRTGSKQLNVLEVCRSLLQNGQKNLLNLYDYSVEEMMKIPGIGKVKAYQLKAIGELSIRISKSMKFPCIRMDRARQVAAYYMEQFRHEKKEHFWVVFLDTKCNFIGDEELSMGTVNASIVSPREVFLSALHKNAVYILILHNHPSGDPTESREDVAITERIKQSGEIVGIHLLDHIIIGDNCYCSFKEKGLL